MENSFSWFFKRLFRWRTKDLKVQKNRKRLPSFLKYGKTLLDYGMRDHMEHSLQITLTKEGTNLLTSAGGKFRLWKMA